ncbi:MAG: glycosyltransferase family 4 protein [Lautropia sp.]
MLLLGPTPSDHPSRIGGTTTSFSLLAAYLRERDPALKVVSTNRWRLPAERIVNALDVLLRCAVGVPRADVVMLNANPAGAVVLGPLIHAYCRLWRRPFVFRMFGGDLIEVVDALPRWLRAVFERTVLRADLVLLQTQRLVSHFQRAGRRVAWLPNARPPPDVRRPTGAYARRLVFVGTIRASKGVDAVLRFRERHRATHEVHLYGPIAEAAYRWLEHDEDYRGVAKPDEILLALADHDLLLLPTRHPGEGYPGVVIEANSVGLPVVATRWLGIPELVHDGENGLLVAPGDDAAFEEAILSIDDARFQRMSAAALSRARTFETTEVYATMLDRIAALRRPDADAAAPGTR